MTPVIMKFLVQRQVFILIPLATTEVAARENPTLPVFSKRIMSRGNFHFISITNPELSLCL